MSRKRPPASHLTVSDLVPDPENARRRTERGARMLVESLAQVGAARSIVIDENNGVLAGNGVVEAAAEAGITNLQVVDTDGQTIIAVRRRGLTPEAKRALAMFDNRTAELAEWDPEQLHNDHDLGRPLGPYFNEGELRRLLKTEREAKVTEVPTGSVQDQFWIAIRGPLQQQARALQRLRELMRDIEGVEVELGTVTYETWEGK
jgi:hypothetical protein